MVTSHFEEACIINTQTDMMFNQKSESEISKTKTGEVDDNDCPIEQVRLTIPTTDDPALPCLTFRTWVLGISSCSILCFLNQFFSFRQNALFVHTVAAIVATMPLGKMMAASLPAAAIRVPGTRWSFSLNPGPFNLKEHVLITMFATLGVNAGSAMLITLMKVYYRRPLSLAAAILFQYTSQMMGYGWAGIYRKLLVDSPYMWWPENLIRASMFRALHDEEKRARGGVTRLQFFLAVFVSSFAYYIVPSYLFPSVSAVSVLCLIWKKSITMQQIGSGVYGLGIGSFGLDWLTASSFLGSPLASPGFVIINIMLGFSVVVYAIVPFAYWTNTYEAKRFPFYSSQVFMGNGSEYDVNRVLDQKNFSFDQEGYDRIGQINLSILFVFSNGLIFASVAAALSHVALFHGRSIWRQTIESIHDQIGDIHTRMMSKYEKVPQWWFLLILVSMLGLAIFACEGFGKQLQLPYWGVLLAAALAFVFSLPIAIIRATTNQVIKMDTITDLVIGYLYPGRPLASVAFSTYSTASVYQAISFLQDFKLGHYMKIPPKSMFIVQLVGTVVGVSTSLGTTWWLVEAVENICKPGELPKGSPWTCPQGGVWYSSSIIWGVVGPARIFGSLGLYRKMNYFLLLGLLAPLPVWVLSRMFPDRKEWIELVHAPLILSATAAMPPARSVNYVMWAVVGIVSNFVVYRRCRGWWARYNYNLSAALDAGAAFLAILTFAMLQNKDINGVQWWGLQVDDHCALARCPTLPGVVAENCPL